MEFLKEQMVYLPYLIDILLGVILGFAIGLERKMRSKEAGVRTHTIVCFGSALIMVISKHGFGGDADSARIAAQIVSGVGFLGAGMIVFKKHEVHGLTTAAGVWATAGIGMACGARMYFVAVGAAFLLILIQFVLHANLGLFKHKKYYKIKIVFYQTGETNLKIKGIFGVDRFVHLVIERTENGVIYNAELHTDKELSSTRLDEILAENNFICSLERCDED